MLSMRLPSFAGQMTNQANTKRRRATTTTAMPLAHITVQKQKYDTNDDACVDADVGRNKTQKV